MSVCIRKRDESNERNDGTKLEERTAEAAHSVHASVCLVALVLLGRGPQPLTAPACHTCGRANPFLTPCNNRQNNKSPIIPLVISFIAPSTNLLAGRKRGGSQHRQPAIVARFQSSDARPLSWCMRTNITTRQSIA